MLLRTWDKDKKEWIVFPQEIHITQSYDDISSTDSVDIEKETQDEIKNYQLLIEGKEILVIEFEGNIKNICAYHEKD